MAPAENTLNPRDAFSRPEARMVHASEKTGAVRTGEYSWRPPSPPHLHIPQTPDDAPLILPAYNGVGCEPGEYTEVLTRITQIPEVKKPRKDWRYELRRKAQSILTFLYLGPSSAARDIEFLKQEGITMLLVIRDTMTAQARLLSGDKVAHQLGIQSMAVDVDGNTGLIAAFPRAIKIINDHLVSNYHQVQFLQNTTNPDPLASCGKVLVFCESGNERSAAVVVAYMLNTYGMDLVSTIQYVQSQRFCLSFDDSLKNLLYNYMEILIAQRSVSQAPKSPVRHDAITNGSKRGRDEVANEDSDMDMGQDDDEARFHGRGSFVPFK